MDSIHDQVSSVKPLYKLRGRAEVAQQAHNLKVIGSIPIYATN
jgi:hypothetical protein